MSEQPAGMTTLRREHREAVALALLFLQHVEEAMRLYLDTCFGEIRARVKDVFPYKRDLDDIRKHSWSALLRELKQMCANDALLVELADLNPDRNFCAHQALLLTSMEDRAYMMKAIGRAEGIQSKAEKCAQALLDETKTLRQRTAPIRTTLRSALDAQNTSPEKS